MPRRKSRQGPGTYEHYLGEFVSGRMSYQEIDTLAGELADRGADEENIYWRMFEWCYPSPKSPSYFEARDAWRANGYTGDKEHDEWMTELYGDPGEGKQQ